MDGWMLASGAVVRAAEPVLSQQSTPPFECQLCHAKFRCQATAVTPSSRGCDRATLWTADSTALLVGNKLKVEQKVEPDSATNRLSLTVSVSPPYLNSCLLTQ